VDTDGVAYLMRKCTGLPNILSDGSAGAIITWPDKEAGRFGYLCTKYISIRFNRFNNRNTELMNNHRTAVCPNPSLLKQ